MYTMATGRFTIFRGTIPDEGGADQPSNVPVATGVLMSINERSQTVFNSSSTATSNATQMPRVVRALVGRCRSNVDVRKGDRIQDEKTGEKFVVMNVTAPHLFGRKPDKALELKQVGT